MGTSTFWSTMPVSVCPVRSRTFRWTRPAPRSRRTSGDPCACRGSCSRRCALRAESPSAEVAPFGIRVLSIEPGSFVTELVATVDELLAEVEDSSPYAERSRYMLNFSKTSLQTGGNPVDVGAAIVAAVSNPGSAFWRLRRSHHWSWRPRRTPRLGGQKERFSPPFSKGHSIARPPERRSIASPRDYRVGRSTSWWLMLRSWSTVPSWQSLLRSGDEVGGEFGVCVAPSATQSPNSRVTSVSRRSRGGLWRGGRFPWSDPR